MALRHYTDRSGVDWNVWNIPPRYSHQRTGAERRRNRERVEADRRKHVERRRVSAPAEWLQGWVCFQSDSEKRRLCPVPEDWEECPENAMEEYLRRAAPVR